MPDGGASIAAAIASAATAAGASSATALSIYGAAYSVTSFALSFKGALLLTTIASSTLTGLNAAKGLPDPGTEIDLQTAADVPRKLVIGKRMAAGSVADRIAFDSVDGDKFDTHALVIALADHRVSRLLNVYADGRQVHGALAHGTRTAITEFDQDDVGGAVGRNRVWMTFYDGRKSLPAFPYLITKSGGANVLGGEWTSAHRGENIAYIVVEMKYDDDGGITQYPNFMFEMEGAMLYDRRKDSTAGGSGSHRLTDSNTWEYSDNPAVAADHYMLGVRHSSGKIIFGPPNLTADDVPYDDFEARADLCDETVSTNSGSQKRYRFNGVISADEPYDQVIGRFATQMAMEPVDIDGRVGFVGGEVRTPVLTLHDGDLSADSESGYDEKKSYADLVTAIEGRFVDPDNLYQPVDFPRIENPDFTDADGEQKTQSLDLVDETDVERAQRLATLRLNRERRQAVLSETYLASAPVGGQTPLKLLPGDWFTRKSDIYGFDSAGKDFEVIRTVYDAVRRTVTVISREVDPSDLAWTATDAVDPDPPPPSDTPVGVPGADAPSTTLTAFAFEDGGLNQPALKITVTGIDERADRIEAQLSRADGSDDPRTFHIDPEDGVRNVREAIGPGVEYRARSRVWAGDQASAWSGYDTATTTSDFIVPTADDVTLGGPADVRITQSITRLLRKQVIFDPLNGIADLADFNGAGAPEDLDDATFVTAGEDSSGAYATTTGATNRVVTKGVLSVAPENQYVLSGTFAVQSAGTHTQRVVLTMYDESFAYLGLYYPGGDFRGDFTASDGIKTLAGKFTGADILAANASAAYVRACAEINRLSSGSPTTRLYELGAQSDPGVKALGKLLTEVEAAADGAQADASLALSALVGYDGEDTVAEAVLAVESKADDAQADATSALGAVTGIEGFAESYWVLNLNANGVVSGINAYVSDGPNQSESVIKLRFDQFIITNAADTAGEYPFELSGGVTYLKTAMIRDATIGTAKIEDAAIASAKIEDLAVGTIKIAGQAVETPKITDNAVTEPASRTLSGTPTISDSSWTNLIDDTVSGVASGETVEVEFSMAIRSNDGVDGEIAFYATRQPSGGGTETVVWGTSVYSSSDKYWMRDGSTSRYNPHLFIITDAPGAGNWTYTLYAQANRTARATNRRMRTRLLKK